MSKNLIEKLQEIWNDLQQEPSVKQLKTTWGKFSRSPKVIKAKILVRKTAKRLQQNPQLKKAFGAIQKQLRANRLITHLFVLGSTLFTPAQRASGTTNLKENDSRGTKTELSISTTMRNLQNIHSVQQLDSLCTKLVSEDTTFLRICSERSAELGSEILRLGKEVQDDIAQNGKKILKERWGNGVFLNAYCIRSALELTTEAATNLEMPEFINGVVDKIKKVNIDSYEGFRVAFAQHPNFKSSTNILSAINKEVQQNPNDIFLVSHYSPNAASKHHTVLYIQGKILSFNRQHLRDAQIYFQGVSKTGKYMNISKTVREDCRKEIIQNVVGKLVDELKKGDTENTKAILAQYIQNPNVSLEDRLLVGSGLSAQIPLVAKNAEINLLDNFSHLRQVRAKLPKSVKPLKNIEAADKQFARAAGRSKSGKTI